MEARFPDKKNSRSPRTVKWRAAQVAGEVTRGLLVALVSAFLLAAGVTDNPRRAKSLDQALRSFGHRAGGPEVLALAALGLACFAVFSGLEALYRRF